MARLRELMRGSKEVERAECRSQKKAQPANC